MKGVLFDMDGVLWDSSLVHARAFAAVSARYGLTPVPYVELAGRSTESAWRYVLARQARPIDEDWIDELSEIKRDLARVELVERPPLAPGLESLATLQASGIPIGLVTGSSPPTAAILRELLAERFGVTFDAVVDAGSGVADKPSPEPYLRGARQLGLAPTECWVLEDSVAGMTSAHSAGTRVVHKDPGLAAHPHPRPVHGCVNSLRQFVARVLMEQRSIQENSALENSAHENKEVRPCLHAA